MNTGINQLSNMNKEAVLCFIESGDLSQLTGKVTYDDIHSGIACDHEKCALARAVERMFPHMNIFIDDYIAISEPKGVMYLDMAMTNELIEWIDKFDNKGHDVKPINLIIREHNVNATKWIMAIEGEFV